MHDSRTNVKFIDIIVGSHRFTLAKSNGYHAILLEPICNYLSISLESQLDNIRKHPCIRLITWVIDENGISYDAVSLHQLVLWLSIIKANKYNQSDDSKYYFCSKYKILCEEIYPKIIEEIEVKPTRLVRFYYGELFKNLDLMYKGIHAMENAIFDIEQIKANESLLVNEANGDIYESISNMFCCSQKRFQDAVTGITKSAKIK